MPNTSQSLSRFDAIHKAISYDTDVSPGMVEIIAGVRATFFKERIASGLDTFSTFTSHAPVKSKTFIRDIGELIASQGYQIIASSSDKVCAIKGLVDAAPSQALIIVDSGYPPIKIHTFGDKQEVDRISATMSKEFPELVNSLTVYSMAGSNVKKREVHIDSSEEVRLPENWMYPALADNDEPFDLDTFYADYMNSHEPIVLLIGPPGTGKTTFIRGLMHKYRLNVGITYDKQLMTRGLDSLLEDMYNGDCDALVFEDSDTLIASREDGNDSMAALLNTSDGLIPNPNKKKMLFSTNLESLSRVDPALLRAGRCFAVLEFKPFTREQAIVVASKMGVEINADDKPEWTLAEISLVKERKVAATNKTKRRSVGFV